MAALEIVDSRIAGWDITFGDTVADNGSSGLFVLGADRRTLDSFDPVAAQMQMFIDDTEVSTGTGTACSVTRCEHWPGSRARHASSANHCWPDR